MQEMSRMLLRLYWILSDKDRLQILGLLTWQEQSVVDLAACLGLKPARVHRHLAKLHAIGVVAPFEEAREMYRCDQVALQAMLRQLMPGKEVTPAESFAGSAWERKVLQDFFIGMRLKDLPMSKPKRQVITRWLLTQFEPDICYTEAQVNEIIQRHHHDAPFFRKELVGMGLMRREEGAYWRV